MSGAMGRRLPALMIANGALVFLVGVLAGVPFSFVLVGRVALWTDLRVVRRSRGRWVRLDGPS